MRSVSVAFTCLFTIFSYLRTHAQQTISTKPAGPIICYQSNEEKSDHIPPTEKFLQGKHNSSARIKTANFEVEYIDFPSDNLAKNAFQFAVDIWETELVSPVTIKIRAQWSTLGAGVLGQAIWGTAFANFDGAQQVNTFYPVALAEKMAGKELNPSTDPDIVATFNSTTNWYFGIDGNTPSGKMDLVTIVLHEIAHGLGFTDTYKVAGNSGSVGLENGGTNIPFVYDLFVENAASVNLFTEVPSPSASMKSQLTSNDIYYNTPTATAGLGARPKLYAPTTFNDGSSISHLDEATFKTPGDANNLMTPQIAFSESIHNPGSILRNIFKDMGWINTKIQHQRLKDTERKDGAPYVITAKILSDNGYQQSQVILHYTSDEVSFTDVPMGPTATANEYQAALPGKTSNWNYGYYISVVDVSSRTFTNPGKVQTQGKPAKQDLIVFVIGEDTKSPEIAHTPVDFIFEGVTVLSLSAIVTDNIAVQNVSVQYSMKGGVAQTIQMQKSTSDDNKYTATINLPSGLVIGDKIEYNISAVDVSAKANKATTPATGMYTVFVTGIMPTRDVYVNNFNQPSIDFVGNSFSVTTPAGFDNGAIHSKHPYDNGSGPNDESNYIYQLQIPIRLNNSNPFIQFEEIVLVEPGEDGSVFGGEDFFDYVVVEGSKDGGTTWKPFADGYDSRAVPVWLTKYNSSISNDNSLATGNPELFRKRTINMLEKGNFAAGDVVLIRFRLFADQAAHGWGWAIDNLFIQAPVTDVEQPLINRFTVYPNPAKESITLAMMMTAGSTTHISIWNAQGQTLFSDNLQGEGNIFQKVIDISAYPEGLYLISAELEGKTLIRKILKTKN
jgi:hypothetical protein